VADLCLGVFLTTLTFIQDGAEDNITGNVVNFRKRQRAAEVIRDIQRWQWQPFNLLPVPSIQGYLDQALNQFSSPETLNDLFWDLSHQREPREAETEKMTRLLIENGFVGASVVARLFPHLSCRFDICNDIYPNYRGLYV
jgi:son of sevenless-like protein